MDVQALVPEESRKDDDASGGAEIGELVCRNPFPSRPLGFFGDTDGSRFHHAYFSQNPGLWTHGDLIEFTPSGGARLHGRSDSLMKVNGIRIGPAEVYRVLDSFSELDAAMATEQRTPDGASQSRMVLLIVPGQGSRGDPQLKVRICKELAAKGSRAHVPDLIVEVDELPMTFNGKPSERAARDVLNGDPVTNRAALKNPGSLDHIRERTAAEEERLARSSATGGTSVADRVRLAWERALGLRDVDPDDNFFDLGGTSLTSARLCQHINDDLGVTIGPWILFFAPTLRSLTLALACPDLGISPIVPLSGAARTGRPVFMVPGMYGDVMELRALANAIVSDRPLYGLRARGLAPGEKPMHRVEDIARDYLAHIRALQPRGPYAFAGFSFGGLVVFEMARLLKEAQETVEFLGLIDSHLHEGCLPRPERVAFWKARNAAILRAIVAAGPQQLPKKLLRHSRFRTHPLVRGTSDELALPPALQRVAEASRRAFAQYRPTCYSGPVTFFRATKREGLALHCEPVQIWTRLAQVETHEFAGTHSGIVEAPVVAELGDRLARLLDRAGSGPVRAGAPAISREASAMPGAAP
jgi:acetoacetyl-CoA synthetase